MQSRYPECGRCFREDDGIIGRTESYSWVTVDAHADVWRGRRRSGEHPAVWGGKALHVCA